MEKVDAMVAGKPVVIFSKTSCCISHAIKSLICDHFGVNPAVVCELDEIPRGREIEQALSRHYGCPTTPTVFIGGECVGGANEVTSLHLNGSLKEKLIRAGAIWL